MRSARIFSTISGGSSVIESGKYVTSKSAEPFAGTCSSSLQRQSVPLSTGARNHGFSVLFSTLMVCGASLRTRDLNCSSRTESSGCGTHEPMHVSTSGALPSTLSRMPSTRTSSSTTRGWKTTSNASSEPAGTTPSTGEIEKCWPNVGTCQRKRAGMSPRFSSCSLRVSCEPSHTLGKGSVSVSSEMSMPVLWPATLSSLRFSPA